MEHIISQQQVLLTEALINHGAALVGYGDISIRVDELSGAYPVAISFAVKYDAAIIEDEEQFHRQLSSLNPVVDELATIISMKLAEWGYGYKVIPISQIIECNEQLDNLNCFSHKFAATRAGLGWIGKNSLLVTPEYGSRVKLCTVLTNAQFQTASPVEESKCGNCNRCVQACPCGAIKNHNWSAGMRREELFDAYVCNNWRLDAIAKIGRKHTCGYCIKACRGNA
ncbi:MAG: 4Fe-4S binding protein [Negativicutes bacterium]|jgi:epoxyqueuosine reductase QueG